MLLIFALKNVLYKTLAPYGHCSQNPLLSSGAGSSGSSILKRSSVLAVQGQLEPPRSDALGCVNSSGPAASCCSWFYFRNGKFGERVVRG